MPSPHGLHYLAVAALCRLTAHQPEVWHATDKFLLLSDYLNYRLCERFIDSSASQVGYLPCDYRRHKWAAAQ